jgi:hypothetical protein
MKEAYLHPFALVMAGLDPAIHVPLRGPFVDDRVKPGHDDQKS